MISCSHWGMFTIPIPITALGYPWQYPGEVVGWLCETPYDSKYLHG